MIKYSLKCESCDLCFESWFSTSKEFDRLKKLKMLKCDNCGSLKINKTIMSPSLLKAKKVNNSEESKLKNIRFKLKEYQKFIKQNFEYVGENFSYEARSLHYGKNKKNKGIYGNASTEDIKELKEEGIETQIIPWIEDKEN
tara:strand:+ start:4060 stop:4482 length:423 start_codon:yes stop_codon:yes gene_type:complete